MLRLSELNDTDIILICEKNMLVPISILVSDYKENCINITRKEQEKFELWKPQKAKIKLSLLDYFKRIEPSVQYGLWANNLEETIEIDKVEAIDACLQEAYEKCPFLYKGERIILD